MLILMTSPTVSSTTQVLPSDIANLFAWYRFNTGITITGSGVSQWNDQTANALHITQATDAQRPTNSSGLITFDGVQQRLVNATATVAQPLTVCLLANSVAWTANAYFWSGAGGCGLFQSAVSPRIDIFAGSVVNGVSDLAVGTYGAISVIFNGVSSSIGINKLTRVTGNAGAGSPTSFSLGGFNDVSNFSNITVKDMAIFSRVLNATELGQMSDYHNSL